MSWQFQVIPLSLPVIREKNTISFDVDLKVGIWSMVGSTLYINRRKILECASGLRFAFLIVDINQPVYGVIFSAVDSWHYLLIPVQLALFFSTNDINSPPFLFPSSLSFPTRRQPIRFCIIPSAIGETLSPTFSRGADMLENDILKKCVWNLFKVLPHFCCQIILIFASLLAFSSGSFFDSASLIPVSQWSVLYMTKKPSRSPSHSDEWSDSVTFAKQELWSLAAVTVMMLHTFLFPTVLICAAMCPVLTDDRMTT